MSSSNDADIPRDPSLRSRMTARDIGEVKDLGVDCSRMTTRKNSAAKDPGEINTHIPARSQLR
ncbi:MAG: hypothetical protein IJY18_01330 [Clostridia bacterium]|nr:hypothetical protein [Clostridia bacterium]